jgi:hypothetical protein
MQPVQGQRVGQITSMHLGIFPTLRLGPPRAHNPAAIFPGCINHPDDGDGVDVLTSL